MLSPKSLLTEEEYLQGELDSEIKHEYLAGDVYAMVGASVAHNRIALNIATNLHLVVKGSGCSVFMSDVKLRTEVLGDVCYYYPDLMLVCDVEDNETYYRTNPCMLIEVLSDSTERIDRREKLFTYTSLPSLKEYLLSSQKERRIEQYLRREDGNWTHKIFTENGIPLACVETVLELDSVYEEVLQ